MTKSFDVFLSHNSKDKPAVRKLAEALRSRGLKVWLDEWELVPGRPWQEALEEVIETTGSSAVLVGKDGLGPWQDEEMRGCLSEFVSRKLPVIPVLLPDAPAVPNLPFFLKRFTWVDLRGGLTEEGIDRLQWGITGSRPDRSNTTSAAALDVATAETQLAAAEVGSVPTIELEGAGTNGQATLVAPTRRNYFKNLSISNLGIILATVLAGVYGYLYVNQRVLGDKPVDPLKMNSSPEGRNAREHPVDWLFLIDTSQSMAKIFGDVQKSLKSFARTTKRGDSVAIYTFDSKVVPGQSILLFSENDKTRLIEQIDGLEPKGLFTHTGEAIDSALARLEEMRPPGSESDRKAFMVLYTNGIEDTRDDPKATRIGDIQIPTYKRSYSIFVWLGKDVQKFEQSSLSTFASSLRGKAMVLQYPEARNIDGLKGELQDVAAKEARIVPDSTR
ncbi:MAG TPA: TIR domain-containing protein [Thermoanaerobaculia bacterium]|nr:TIR domain-containing protein [Thermoanaerobaculia bacterium]